MTHKALEVIGKRIFLDRILHDAELDMLRDDIAKGEGEFLLKEIVQRGKERKEGIFQGTMIIGKLDFIEPLYPPADEALQEYLEGQKKINPENPLLNVYYEIDAENLNYDGKEKVNIPVFEADLYQVEAKFITDSNPEFRDYADGLRNAGFKIY